VDPRDLAAVRAWLARHRHDVMRRYGARGIGVGRAPDGTRYVLVLYLDRAPTAQTIPAVLDGIPVRIEITGPFTAHPSRPPGEGLG